MSEHRITWFDPERPVENGTVFVRPAPPRTWWSPSADVLYADRRLGYTYEVDLNSRFGDELPEDAVELVPAPDLARLRAGWALLEEWVRIRNAGYLDFQVEEDNERQSARSLPTAKAKVATVKPKGEVL